MARKPVTKHYGLRFTARFVRDFKGVGSHPEYERDSLETLLDDLTANNPMPAAYREHDLDGNGRNVNWTGYTSCDLSPDLRVIFKRHEARSEVALHRIGGHAALYGNRK